MPVAAMAASSAAIFSASAWWPAAARAVGGRPSLILAISHGTGGFFLYKCSVNTGAGAARRIPGWGAPAGAPRAAGVAPAGVGPAGPGGPGRGQDPLWGAGRPPGPGL